jgi:fibronectin type 3 domain-containing protein
MPGIPQVTSTVNSSGKVTLSWAAISGADHYGVWYQNTSGTWTAINTNVKTTSIDDSSVSIGSTRVYAVRAYKGSTYSDFKPVTVVALGIPQVTLSASSGKTVLSWTKINGADHYGVWYQSANGTWTLLNANVTTTAFTDTTVPVGSTRVYAVRAYKGSTYSNFKPVTMPGLPQVTSTVGTAGRVVLSWAAIKLADKYGVWYQNANGTWTALNTNVTTTTFTDTTAPVGSTRVYAVRAYSGVTYSDFKSVTVNIV